VRLYRVFHPARETENLQVSLQFNLMQTLEDPGQHGISACVCNNQVEPVMAFRECLQVRVRTRRNCPHFFHVMLECRDAFGTGNKFMTPVVANGKVFVGTPAGVAVFGLR